MTSSSPSHLDVIERRFLAMTAGPHPLTLARAALGCGLPAEVPPLDEVRALVPKRQTSRVSQDAVYGQLYRAAFRRGHEVCNSERRRAMTRSDLTDVADLRSAGGHPALVLAGAMLSGIVTPQPADRGQATRNEPLPGRLRTHHRVPSPRRPPARWPSSSGRTTSLVALRAPKWHGHAACRNADGEAGWIDAEPGSTTAANREQTCHPAAKR